MVTHKFDTDDLITAVIVFIVLFILMIVTGGNNA